MNTRKTYLELEPGDIFLVGVSEPMYVFTVLETTTTGYIISEEGSVFKPSGFEDVYNRYQLRILNSDEEAIDAFLKEKNKERLIQILIRDIDYSSVPMELLSEVSGKLEKYSRGLNND